MTAGFHSFNGNGEMTGTIWLDEQGLLATPVCITNTHSVGVVRDAVIAYAVRERVPRPWLLPVVAETYDGWLSEADRLPVTAAHAFAALDGASRRRGRRGLRRWRHGHDLLTSSRAASARRRASPPPARRTWTVGALVQANYGSRDLLRVDGVPVGREIGRDVVPSHRDVPAGGGSIIAVLADRCAARSRSSASGWRDAATVGASRGSAASARNGSGDIFLAFSTGNRALLEAPVSPLRMSRPRPDDAAVRGGGGGDRGGDPERPDGGRNDHGTRGSHRSCTCR